MTASHLKTEEKTFLGPNSIQNLTKTLHVFLPWFDDQYLISKNDD